MSGDITQEKFGYTHHKTKGGLTFSVWKDLNSTSLNGNYLSLLTVENDDSPTITQVTIDITDANVNIQIHSPEETTSESLDSPGAAFTYIDKFAYDNGLTSFDPKSRDRDTI